MNNEVKKQRPYDLVLLSGLILSFAFTVTNKCIVEVPDVIAIPWMIISCILMMIGLYRTGKMIGGKFKK